MTAPRVLLLVPARTYRAADFLTAASRLGLDLVVGSDGALRSGSPGLTGTTGRPPSGRAPSLPTTRSSPNRLAAVRKSAAR